MTDGGTLHVVSVEAADLGERLDRLIARRLPALSRSRVKALIEAGHVAQEDAGGGTITDPSRRVKLGQSYRIAVPEAAPAAPQAQAMALDIVYEDADLIVVNKPAGLVVHPAPGNPDATLVNALLAHCGDSLQGIGGVKRPGIVHRLDKDTSGLMVVAKNDAAHASLSRQFAERTSERTYRAIVWGVPRPAEGEIEGTIGRDPRNRKRMAVVAKGGKPALTRYRVIRRFGAGIASLVECRLATGRTHQIRVHLAQAGHPLLGDPVYGGRRGRATARGAAGGRPDALASHLAGFGRQALHAATLGFSHPRSARAMQYQSDDPADFKELIKFLDSFKDKL
ncbi:MAG: RluA family pseudouridine synthase [Rhodospirillales bacterium]|nr:RluA family pseudouridine synthase [Rhodospirillales bacterium]